MSEAISICSHDSDTSETNKNEINFGSIFIAASVPSSSDQFSGDFSQFYFERKKTDGKNVFKHSMRHIKSTRNQTIFRQYTRKR